MQDQLKQKISAALLVTDCAERSAKLRALMGSAGRTRRSDWRSQRQDPANETWLRAIFDSAKDAIIAVNSSGRILRINRAAERIFCIDAGAPVTWLSEIIPTLTPASASLEALSARGTDTLTDLAPHELVAERVGGEKFAAELAVSRVRFDGNYGFVICLRDVSERRRAEGALRDSEARYRALVENSPEAIVVLDVDLGRFVDANDKAAELFKLEREEILKLGPEALSPERQSDGLPSFGLERGYIERALSGGRPVFEWLHLDSTGREIPCEVRLIRLPDRSRRLVRASMIDIASRRRADILGFGERRILEQIVAGASEDKTLKSIVRLFEQIYPELSCVVMGFDEATDRLQAIRSASAPERLLQVLAEIPLGLQAGSCASAVALGRQVIAADIASDPLWEEFAGKVLSAGFAACWSTPIFLGEENVFGTLAVYSREARSPRTGELDVISRLVQLASIAVKRQQDESALMASEARYRGLFENVADGVYQTDAHGYFTAANPALVRLLGFETLADLIEHGPIQVHFRNPKDFDRLRARLLTDGYVRSFEYELERQDGTTRTVVESAHLVRVNGEVEYIDGMISDITERKRAEQALYAEKERAQVTLKSIGDAVVTTDAEGRVEYLNPVAEQLTGLENRVARGSPVSEVVQLINDETGEPADNPVDACLEERQVTAMQGSLVLRSHSGEEVAIQDSAAPILDDRGELIGAIMVFHDVSQERQLHHKLSYHAAHDSLTGLINRREFEALVSKALARSNDEPDFQGALLYLDLDQFKVVNDTCGHAAGDQLLRQLAEVLRSRVRASDVIARLGGDEFAVLLQDCSISKAISVGEDLREAISEYRFRWRDGQMAVGVSIGVAGIDESRTSVASLLSASDVACYVAKDQGRNRIHVYQEGDAADRHQEMQWVARINKARDEQRFELYCQPIVPIDGGHHTVQHELLLRMRDADGSLVQPNTFIPAAERYNLMPGLDRWVVHQALSRHLYDHRSGGDPYTLAINLSGTSLNDAKFLDFLVAELANYEPADGSICFEITETAAITDVGKVVNFMTTLKRLGCQFSLDDFGSGLSSLTYLKNLPVDFLKIDGHFVHSITRDAVDETMIRAIVTMARAMGIATIAERVESRDVLERLVEIGVAYAQGFYISVPKPVQYLDDRPARPITALSA